MSILEAHQPSVRLGTKNAGSGSCKTDPNNISFRNIYIFIPSYLPLWQPNVYIVEMSNS